MQDNSRYNFLDILLGEKLSTVAFVMDYLQIDFDGNGFNLDVWPVVTINGHEYRHADTDYRNKLCSLIAKVVRQVEVVENEQLTIWFENGDQLAVSLDLNNPELVTPEIAVFTDTKGKCYFF
jgi:hypothetical protein